MEFAKFNDKYFLRLDRGEEITATLKEFCQENKISLAKVSGIGAVNKATIGLFETSTKEYHTIELKGDHEITSLTGNISTMNGETYLHLHVNLADHEYNTRGGHLSSAVISATGEFILEAVDGVIDREFSQEIGLNLYKF